MIVVNDPSSIRHYDLNSRHLEHESHPLTIRQRLQPILILFYNGLAFCLKGSLPVWRKSMLLEPPRVQKTATEKVFPFIKELTQQTINSQRK